MVRNEVREKPLLQSFVDVLIQNILLAFLLILPWFYGLTVFRDQLIAQVSIFSFFLIAYPFLRRSRGLQIGRSSFDAWVILSLGVGFFYVLASALPFQSSQAFLRLLSCVVFYVLIRNTVRTDKALRFFLWGILILGGFYSFYGLLQYYKFLPHPFWYQPTSLASRYVNGGHFGALLLFPLFMGMSLLVSSRSKASQCVAIFLLLLIGSGLLLTHSRAVWIAALGGNFLFIFLGKRNRFLNPRATSGMLLLIGIGGLLFLSRGGLQEIFRRFGELGTTRFYSLINRGQLWQGALSAISERPWGWGLGMFGAILPRYRVQADRFFIDYAHNEFLQVGVDLGILGILILAGFIFFYFRKGWFFLKKAAAPDFQKSLAAGFLALWASLAVVSQVDFPLRIYATGILFAGFLGLSAYLFEPVRIKTSSSFKKGFWLIPWVFVLIANFITTRQLFAELHFDQGKKLENNFSWSKADAEYEHATHLFPFSGLYYEALGLLSERRAGVAFNREQRKILLERAIHAYEEANRLQPYRAQIHYSLALLYERKGDLSQARSEFLKAIASEPTNALFVSEYGYFALRHSWAEEAIGAFEKLKSFSFRGEAKGDLDEILARCYRVTQDYDQLLRIVPERAVDHSHFARFLGEKGRWDLAHKEFQEAIEQTKLAAPDYRSYFDNLGRWAADFYLSHNHLEEALEIYREAAAMLPNDEGVKKKILEISQGLKPPDVLGLPQ